MNQVAILYPVFVQVLLVVVVGMSMAVARARAVKTVGRERGNPDLAMGRFAWPDDAAKRAANYRNQFEAPVLFYVLVLLVLNLRMSDIVLVTLAWIFVLTRLAHAYIHTSSNVIRLRGGVYGIGVLVLLLMWIWLAIRLLSATV